MVDLIPVDHDPFAPPTLIPVDHDPFAGDQVQVPPQEWRLPDLVAMTGMPSALEQSAAATAANPWQPGMTAGQVLAGRPDDPLAGSFQPGVGVGAIKAFHASPHDFDAFDISKVGSGQGAASYGHGLYTAENPAVSGPGGQYDREFTAKNLGKPDLNQLEDFILRSIRSGNGPVGVMQDLAENHPYLSFEDAHAAYQRVDAAKAKIYDTQINADPEHFLDWDKPATEQSEPVKQALNQLWEAKGGSLEGRQYPPFAAHGEATGNSLHAALATTYGGPEQATIALREAGIPGIRYLDQGSRGAGEGTHNYVVFDDKLIDIIKKYGLAGLVAGGAATIGGSTAGATHLIPVEHDPFAEAAQ
jgi:hypothetical protein